MFGVVILNYKDYDTTIKCVRALEKLTLLEYIVVVDNKSPNESWEKLKIENIGKKWKLIQSDSNKGYSAGNNIGIKYLLKYTDVTIIGVVNPDVMFDDMFLRELNGLFERYNEYGMLSGVQLDNLGKVSVNAFWPRLSRWDLICQNLSILMKLLKHNNKKANYISKKLSTDKEIVEVSTLEGCCFFIRREVIEAVKLLDEDVFLFYEEDILSRKLHRLKWKVGVATKCKFIHNHSTTIKSVYSDLQLNLQLKKSRGIFYRKYASKNIFDYVIYVCFECFFYIEKIIIYLYKYIQKI